MERFVLPGDTTGLVKYRKETFDILHYRSISGLKDDLTDIKAARSAVSEKARTLEAGKSRFRHPARANRPVVPVRGPLQIWRSLLLKSSSLQVLFGTRINHGAIKVAPSS